MSGTSALGRPTPSTPFLRLLCLTTALALLCLEGALHLAESGLLAGPFASLAETLSSVLTEKYLPVRAWVLGHRGAAAALGLAGLLALLLAYRAWLLFWHNEVLARLSGTKFIRDALAFPSVTVDLLEQVAHRPPGHCFVGVTPVLGLLGRRWKPVYISPRQRTMHRHVLGKTGSGKTLSVLWPSVLQDALDGKGVLVCC